MKAINVRWSTTHARYSVSERGWGGGRVYVADEVDAEIARLTSALRASREAIHKNTNHAIFCNLNAYRTLKCNCWKREALTAIDTALEGK